MKTKALYLIISLVVMTSACKKDQGQSKPEPKPIKLTEKSAEIIKNSNAFGINLLKLTSQTEPGNLMLSPLSASAALTMLLNGSDGQTKTQIHQMLGYTDLSQAEVNQAYKNLVSQLLTIDPKVKIAIANAVWYRKDFQVKTPFLDTMETTFNAKTESLDFSSPNALNTINGWANDNTFGKIPKVLNEISGDAVMFLMNALYFKGNWTTQFNPDHTSPETFYLENGTTTYASMMHGKVPAKIYSNSEFKAIELYYGQTNYSMDILIPTENLNALIENLSDTMWLNMTTHFDSYNSDDDIELVMPRFKFEYEKILNDQLKILGMIDAFNSELADLSGISDANIFVNFVKQNTFIDVNEEGTEAAAVTTIGIDVTSMPEPFLVNRPFIFAIRERMSNTILFIGKVTEPLYN